MLPFVEVTPPLPLSLALPAPASWSPRSGVPLPVPWIQRLAISVADPERFYPDPSFHVDADPRWGVGCGRRGERLSVSEERRYGGSQLGSDLNLDPDPWKMLWIRIRQNDADPLDPDPQHCLRVL